MSTLFYQRPSRFNFQHCMTVKKVVDDLNFTYGDSLAIHDTNFDLVKNLPADTVSWVYFNKETAEQEWYDEAENAADAELPRPAEVQTLTCPDGYLIVADDGGLERDDVTMYLVYAPTWKETQARIDLDFDQNDEGGVYIYDHDGMEVVMWNTDEFAERDGALPAAMNAICMFYQFGVEHLNSLLRRPKN